MKIVKILNAFAVILIFSPFFQMCNDSDKISFGGTPQTTEQFVADSIAADTSRVVIPTTDSVMHTQADVVKPTMEEEKGFMERVWEQITFPGKDSTGFGLMIYTLMMIFDGGIMQIEWLEWLTAIAVILTIVSFVRVLRKKHKKLTLFYSVNAVVLIGAFLAALNQLDHLHQIKWGFYSYFVTILVVAAWSFKAKVSRVDV
jgi:hypothetical protein